MGREQTKSGRRLGLVGTRQIAAEDPNRRPRWKRPGRIWKKRGEVILPPETLMRRSPGVLQFLCRWRVLTARCDVIRFGPSQRTADAGRRPGRGQASDIERARLCERARLLVSIASLFSPLPPSSSRLHRLESLRGSLPSLWDGGRIHSRGGTAAVVDLCR